MFLSVTNGACITDQSLSPCVVSASLHGISMALSCQKPVFRISCSYLLSDFLCYFPFFEFSDSVLYCNCRTITAIHPLIECTNSSFRHLTRSPGTELFIVMGFTLNSGQYQHLPQMHGLPTGFQYDNDEDPVHAQSSHPMFCDGLPRTPSQHLMNLSSLAPNSLSTNYSLLHPIPMSHSSIAWGGNSQHASGFENQTGNNYYGSGSNFSSIDEHNSSSFLQGSAFSPQQEVPRFLPNMFNNSIPLDDGYEPSAYIVDSSKAGLQKPNPNAMGYTFEYQAMSNVQDLKRLNICTSPVPKIEQDDDVMSFKRPPTCGLSSSVSSEEGNSSREMTAIELDDHNIDEPYAKLIHRALMSAPNHSMVLQEIYQWFRENTQKGSSDTKGWMNSIRHNLSMNAVSLS